MNVLWAYLMIFIGLFILISASVKSEFIVYRPLVARSKILWGEKVYLFHQISGLLVIIFGFLIVGNII